MYVKNCKYYTSLLTNRIRMVNQMEHLYSSLKSLIKFCTEVSHLSDSKQRLHVISVDSMAVTCHLLPFFETSLGVEIM